MKSKFKFFGIVALISVASFTVQSCAKDFSEDIDALKAQIAAAQASITSLQTAINAGKLVKTVTSITNGYTITFSDNTSITITNGVNGATGTTGATGATGAAGVAGATGFTPIIGIDAEGYWTVVASQGAAPTRILVGGLPVLAKVTAQNLTLGADNYLYIDGALTTCYIPNIAYNATTRRLMVWVKDPSTGVATLYEVPLADDVVLYSDILALVCPTATSAASLYTGEITAAELATPTYGAGTPTVGTWAGITAATGLNTLKLPVIVNPANATIEGYTFKVVTSSGTYYFTGTLSAGWVGALPTAGTGAVTGLYTLTINPTPTQLTDFPASATQLAVTATKGTRTIVSQYQYSITKAAATSYTLTASTTNTVKIASGTESDAVTLNTAARTSADFYKVVVTMDAAGTTDALEPYVSITGGKVKLTSAAVEGSVKLKVEALDYNGLFTSGTVVQPYFSPLTISSAVSIAAAYTIPADTATTTTLRVDLQPFFDKLAADGKLAIWRANATSLGAASLPDGVTASFEKIDAITTLPAATTSAADVQYMLLTFDNADLEPTTTAAAAKFTYADGRIDGTTVIDYTESQVSIPLTIANPDLTANIAAVVAAHKPAFFTGQQLGVWASIAGSFDLTVAYDGLTAALGKTANIQNTILFTESPAANGDGAVTSPTFAYTTPDTTTVKVEIQVCGNTDNKVTVETISVGVKSSSIPFTIEPKLNGTAPIALYVNHAAAAVTTAAHPAQSLSNYLLFKDALAAGLSPFGDYVYNAGSAISSQTVDPRLDDPTSSTRPITVEATGSYAGLVTITGVATTSFPGTSITLSTDYTFAATYTSTVGAPILNSDVVVPLKITIRDRFDRNYVQYVDLTVKKP